MRTLELINDGKTKTFTIGRTGSIIEGKDNMYCSREHVRIMCSPDAVLIMDISKNGTTVDGTPLPKGMYVTLKEGSLVDMAGTIFYVTLKGWKE